MSTSIVPGSLSSVATAGRMSLAEAFLSADHLVLLDVSPSMEITDSVEGQSRFAVACRELGKLQAELPGRVAIFEFSGDTWFCPSGQPIAPHGSGTLIAQALRFVAPADGLLDFWIISDGEPQDGDEALAIARRMQSRINGVYVGPRAGDGADFLRQLCAIRGGKAEESVAAADLAGTIRRMIGAGASA